MAPNGALGIWMSPRLGAAFANLHASLVAPDTAGAARQVRYTESAAKQQRNVQHDKPYSNLVLAAMALDAGALPHRPHCPQFPEQLCATRLAIKRPPGPGAVQIGRLQSWGHEWRYRSGQARKRGHDRAAHGTPLGPIRPLPACTLGRHPSGSNCGRTAKPRACALRTFF